MKMSLLVTVRTDGNYYTDADDLAGHVSGWIRGALDDRDDIYDDGLSITRVQPPRGHARPRMLHPVERVYMLDAARGYTAQQTAGRHVVTVNTVNTALKRAKAALGTRTIAHAVAQCLATGEFTTDDLPEEG